MKRTTKIWALILSVLMVASAIPALSAIAGNAKVLWTSSFEDGIDGWTSIDADSDGYGWEHKTAAESTRYADYSGMESEGCAVSASFANETVINPENYLVSPEIELAGKYYQPVVSWYTGNADKDFYADYYSVYVYGGEEELTAENIAEKLSDETVSSLVYSESLQSNEYCYKACAFDNSYIGKSVKVVFVHHNCSEQGSLKIDEVSVSAVEKVEGAEITGITAPEVNEVPSTSAEVSLVADGEVIECSGLSVYWEQKAEDAEEWTAMDSAVFKTGLCYRVCCEITVEGEYIFSDSLKTATINGNEAERISGNEISETLTVAYAWAPMYQIIWDWGNDLQTDDYYTQGEEIVVPRAITKKGQIFKGWDKEIPATATENITFTSIWEAEVYTVIWDVDGVQTSETYKYGDIIVKPADPDKEHYDFAGWSPVVPDTMPDIGNSGDSVIYTAAWELHTFDITWIVNGEEETVTYGYGEEIVEPVPEREGYVFMGWDGEIPETMPDENLTFTSIWEAAADTKYTVNIHTMNTEGEYETETQELTGTTEETAEAVYEVGEGFSFNAEKSVTSGVIAADGSLVLDVYLDRNTVTLTFDTDGGNDIADITQLYGSAVTAPEAPVKEGYVFAGWDNQIPEAMPAEGISFKASWTPATDTKYTVNIHTMNTEGEYETETQELTGTTEETAEAVYEVGEGFSFNAEKSVTSGVIAADGSLVLDVYIDRKTVTLSFDSENGTAAAPVIGLYGSAVAAPEAPEKEGYTFLNWEPAVPETIPAEDAEFKAVWQVNAYNAVFNANGGAFADGETSKTVATNYGEAVQAPENPEKLGFEFAGWEPAVPSEMPAENIELSATWTDAERNVEYWFDGALYAIYTLNEGDAFAVPESPEKNGFSFSHWSLTDDGEAAALPEAMPALGEGEILKYYAVFTVNTYNLIIDIDGVLTEVPYKFGDAVEIPADPEKEGYSFACWEPLVPATMPWEDYTVTATWEIESYTLKFNTDGGSEIADITAEYGASIEIPADPEKEGYTFAGWDAEIPAVMPDLGDNGAEKTYTASWNINQYTITFDTDGGSEIADITAEYGASIEAPADPEKEGYTFAGWDKDIPTEMPAGNMTVTAQWTANEYDAVFDAGEGVYADGTTSKTVPVSFGKTPEAPEIPEKEGYVFTGWTPELVPMGVEGAVYTAAYSASSVNYTVDVYTMGTDGEYGEPVSEAREGTADTTVAITPEEKEGFTLDAEASVLEGYVAADGSLVLSVYYSRNQYDFTVNVDGEETTEKYYFEATVSYPENPEKEGCSFKEWEGYSEKMPAQALTVTAVWEIESYTLKFNTDGGNEIADITAEYGAAIEIPADPEKEGHTFAGWSEKIPEAMPDLGDNGAEKTFTASWTVNEYTVTWIVDGEETVETYKYGEDIVAPVPDKDGYIFAGWDAEIPAEMPAENLIFTASWEASDDTKYRVLIYTMKADGTYGSPSASIKAGETETVVSAEYTVPNGYVLNSEKSITSGAIKADGSLVLTVYIDRKTFTISFDSDGGTAVAPVTGLYGSAVTAPEAPEKTGYEFTGWENGLPETMPAEDITLKATWVKKEYTITFENIGRPNNEPLVVTYFYGDKVETPEVNVATGFTFLGWDKEIPDTMPAENLVIKARMSINKYNATFDANGGKIALADGTMAEKRVNSVNYNTTIKLPADPVRDGYVFAGWEGYKSGMKMSASDVTFTAKWTAAEDTKYIVNIHTMGLDGKYVTSSQELAGTTETTVYAQYEVAEGFELNSNSITEGTVKADGSLVLDVYLDRKTVTIHFSSLGGTYSEKITQLYGTAVEEPAAPVREGYTFAGWDRKVPETMPASSITISAKWTLNGYNVTFKADGGKFADGTEEKTVVAYYGETVENVPAGPERAGYTFLGWDNIPDAMPANDVTVTALWSANTYDAVFKANGGKFADGSGEARVPTVFGAAIEAPADPERAGYIFNGWTPAVGTMNTVGGCTFEAQWKPATDTKYTVNIFTMGTDGNYVKQTSTLAGATGEVVNASYSIPAGFELSKTQNNSTSGVIAADGSLVLNVYLDRKLVTVYFDTNGGSAVEPVTQIYGSKLNAPASPVKKGYKFTGWSSLPSTMPANDITVYANYTCNAGVTIKNNTGSKTIDYGDTLRLTAVTTNMPENTAICWYVDGVKRGEGETFDLTFDGGTKAVTVKLVDKSTGDVLENEYGTEIADLENVSMNSGFFQQIISFFKNLFGINRTVSQMFGRKF